MPQRKPFTKEQKEYLIYEFAWHMVNTSAGQKAASYRKAANDPSLSPSAGYIFYNTHKEEIDKLIEEFRAENRKNYPQIRDNNIAILTEIATGGTRNQDRINAVKELNNMCGYNTQNINVNGKVDSEIEITLTNM